ncbi:MAG: hypothetical protein IK086_02855 [Clostridia bacterium]|nr:hypothetical protein [Clostridia bacterium]
MSDIKDGSLAMAVLYEYPLLSFKTDKKWEVSSIRVKKDYIDDTPSEIIEIHNFCDGLKQENKDWIDSVTKDILLDKYPTSKELIKNLFNIFPNLCFHETALKQLESEIYQSGYKQLLTKLQLMNEYFEKMDTNCFQKEKFPPRTISEESKATLDRFEADYTFCFEGKKYLIKYHIRYTGNSKGRIYFVPLEKERKGLIYSLTTKLPTVSEPKFNI